MIAMFLEDFKDDVVGINKNKEIVLVMF